MAESEKVLTLNFSKIYKKPTVKRLRSAMSFLRQQAARHAKRQVSEVKIDNAVNQEMYSHGMKKIPRKLKFKLIVDDKLVLVVPPEKDVKTAELKKAEEAKEAKKAEKKEVAKKEKEEAKKDAAESEGETKTEKPKHDQKQLKGTK